MKPYLATDLKMMNRQNVYRLLEQKNELSRAEISRITNISMPTVMKIVAHFVADGAQLWRQHRCQTLGNVFQGAGIHRLMPFSQ